MKTKRRRRDSAFKSRVAIEALKEQKTVRQIASEYEIHPAQVSEWKKTLMGNLPEIFEGKKSGKQREGGFEKERNDLHAKIGELTVELDFAIKKSKQLGL